MKTKLKPKKTSPKAYAEKLFFEAKKIFKEFHLSRSHSPLAIVNVNNIIFLSFLASLFRVLIEEKNPNLLEEIVKEYRQLLKREFPGEIAYVKTAIPLTEEEEVALNERLASIFGKYYLLEIEVKPELIGGLTVEVEDKVLDESVLGKIKELEQHLNL